MQRAAVFFDRDNTLIANEGYLGDPAQVRLIDGAAAAIARARAMGFAVVTVSNQSGVARGMFPEEAVHAVNGRLAELLKQTDPAAIIDRHEFCPFHPEATVERYKLDSDLRKPKPGMLLRAAKMLDLDLSRSWMVGDAPRDIEAGKAAGCRTILFTGAEVASSAAEENASAQPEATVATLDEAMQYIVGHSAPEPEPAATTQIISDDRVAMAGPATEAPTIGPSRLEKLAEQILSELRRRNDQNPSEFSVTKLLAGVSQAIALGALIGAYFLTDRTLLEPFLLVALTLQTMTITLMMMSTPPR